jgi:hypothetical protein
MGGSRFISYYRLLLDTEPFKSEIAVKRSSCATNLAVGQNFDFSERAGAMLLSTATD